MSMHGFFYQSIQNLIGLIIGKISFTEQFSNYLDNNRYTEIHDMSLGDFLDKNWFLVCARFSQKGAESSETVKATLSCMEQNPNYLIVF